jgi:hypothetical protein
MRDQIFLPYELSLELKKIGFDRECLGVYDNEKNFYLFDEYCGRTCEVVNSLIRSDHVTAPLYQQAIDYLESKGYYINLFDEFHQWILMVHRYVKDENPEMNVGKHEIWKHKGPYKDKIVALCIAIREIVKLIIEESNEFQTNKESTVR